VKERLKAIFKGPVVFYPLLFAAFPLLFLYTYNIDETAVSEIWLPLVISVAAALVLWAVMSLILGSLSKAGLATAIFLVFFFSYGHLCEELNYLGVFVPRHAHLLLVMLFVWGYCVYFISRAKRDFRVTTKLFNITAVALIAINLFNIASYQINLDRLNTATPEEPPARASANATELSTLPDIYLIITDEYAHPDTIQEWYDYDNSEFIESLEDKGFFVAHESRTRVMKTRYSIATTLNMEYIPSAKPSGIVAQMISTNKVLDFLKQRGYRQAFLKWIGGGMGTYGVYTDLPGDFQSPERNYLMTDFFRLLWNTTMLRPFYNYIYGPEYIRSRRNDLIDTLSYLKTMPDIEGPKFVFAHLMCPHEPFIFGPDGELVDIRNVSNYADKQFYLGQYIFMSRELERLVEVILEKSSNPPIIIIQSDHGLRPHHPNIEIGSDEWQKILNAMYLPGMDNAVLFDNMSPANTFRVIFNHYFGANYPLLEDD
jgi:hypothetical protein